MEEDKLTDSKITRKKFFELQEASKNGDLKAGVKVAYELLREETDFVGKAEKYRECFKLFDAAVKQSHDTNALNGLAYLYCHGLGVKKDLSKAISLYSEAGKQKSAKAVLNLGLLYYSQQNYLKASEYFRQATERGSSTAFVYRGLMFKKGLGVGNCDHLAAIQSFMAAVDSEPKAQYYLSKYYMYGVEGILMRDEMKGFQLLEKASLAGLGRASHALGLMYLYGKHNCQKNVEKGLNLLISAAQAKDIAALLELGRLYECDQKGPVKPNLVTSLSYYRRGSELGNIEAILCEVRLTLGPSANPLVRNDERAIRLLKLAADEGNPSALVLLGSLYFNGDAGLEKNTAKAFTMFELSAAKNHPDGELKYSQCLLYGVKGVCEANPSKALRILCLPSQQNTASSLFLVGLCYENGTGVAPDINIAMKNYFKSWELGRNTHACFRLALCFKRNHNMHQCVEYLKKAIGCGEFPDALVELGRLYWNGLKNDIPKNEIYAIELWQRAAACQSARAYYCIGKALLKSSDEKIFNIIDNMSPLHWFKLASKKEYTKADFALGHCYLSGVGDAPKNSEIALSYFKRAAANQCEEALVFLGKCYRTGAAPVNTLNHERAFTCFVEAAELGNAEAQFCVGNYYRQGIGVPDGPSIDRTIAYYKLSAKQNYPGACANLGSAYLSGLGVAKNVEKAQLLFERACKMNDKSAIFNLGVMCARGLHSLCSQGKPDFVAAVSFYKRASAEHDFDLAHLALGICYACGRGVQQQDYREAFRLFTLASRSQSGVRLQAMVQLGLLHLNGNAGLKKNAEEAVRLFDFARPDPLAYYHYGRCIEKGEGFGKGPDLLAAMAEYEKSAKLGCSVASYRLGQLYRSGDAVLPRSINDAMEYFALGKSQGSTQCSVELNELRLSYERSVRSGGSSVRTLVRTNRATRSLSLSCSQQKESQKVAEACGNSTQQSLLLSPARLRNSTGTEAAAAGDQLQTLGTVEAVALEDGLLALAERHSSEGLLVVQDSAGVEIEDNESKTDDNFLPPIPNHEYMKLGDLVEPPVLLALHRGEVVRVDGQEYQSLLLKWICSCGNVNLSSCADCVSCDKPKLKQMVPGNDILK